MYVFCAIAHILLSVYFMVFWCFMEILHKGVSLYKFWWPTTDEAKWWYRKRALLWYMVLTTSAGWVSYGWIPVTSSCLVLVTDRRSHIMAAHAVGWGSRATVCWWAGSCEPVAAFLKTENLWNWCLTHQTHACLWQKNVVKDNGKYQIEILFIIVL